MKNTEMTEKAVMDFWNASILVYPGLIDGYVHSSLAETGFILTDDGKWKILHVIWQTLKKTEFRIEGKWSIKQS